MKYLIATLVLWAAPLWAQSPAQIVILGEVHDNPAHHVTQTEWVAQIAPKALVFEMLTKDQAARITPQNRTDAAQLAQVLDWEASGWPDFSMYAPIFAAASNAGIFGAAVPRDQTRAAMAAGVATYFGPDAASFGLDSPLSPDEQSAREAFQMAAHCDALPPEMLPIMVDIQRLRDAQLARVALDALRQTGGPVAVITGNGHARRDWGMVPYVLAAAPDVTVFSLGQSEAGLIEGRFDRIVDAPAVDRPDPCDAFRK